MYALTRASLPARAHAQPATRRKSRPPAVVALVAALALALAPVQVRASVGDRAPAYQRCTRDCRAQLCDRDFGAPPPPADSPWAQYSPSLLWPCPDTCSYACQHHLTDLALAVASGPHDPALLAPGGRLEGLPVGHQVQFHGKWAFHRLDWSGLPLVPWFPLRILDLFLPRVQEPLSALFSLANLWAHARGLATLRTLARTGRMTEGRRLARVYAAYAWSGILAWVASAVFHTRDTPATERADYVLAAATMLVGLWAGVVRLQGWYASSSKGARLAPAQRRAAGVWTVALAGVFALHCTYLLRRERFDYAYNMQFNVVVALATIVLWAAWVARQARLPSPSNFSRRQLSSYPSARARFRAPHYTAPLAPLVALPALAALELLDFAPKGPGGLRLVDAHALWHASTVAVVGAWYAFLEKDVRWIDGQGERGDPASVLPASAAVAAVSRERERSRDAGADREAHRRASLFSLERLQSEGRRMTAFGRGIGLGILGIVAGSASSSSSSSSSPPLRGTGLDSGVGGVHVPVAGVGVKAERGD
ncbi:hypothetical protein JCM3770_004223 [Rhodotorula araucariae]